MGTHEIAKAFTALCTDGKFDEAGNTYWSNNIVSIEAMDGPMARVAGRDAVDAKAAWWYANHVVHSINVEGPYVNGNQFTVRFTMDVTPKDGKRMVMDEHGLYTVQDAKIVEERFFYSAI
jgi:ketosteroid isomerase-like protein